MSGRAFSPMTWVPRSRRPRRGRAEWPRRPASHQSRRGRGILCAGLAILIFAFVPACKRKASLDPPTIRYGEDACIDCGMIISDERFSAASLADDPDEGILPLLFDDIGDMLKYERDNPGITIVRRFVHDHPSKTWIPAETAHYIYAQTLETPMATGLAAFSDPAAADALLTQHPGTRLDFAALQERYKKK